MRIGMLLYNDFVNDNRVHREARDLTAAGHEVLIVAARSRPDLPEQESPGYSVRRVPVSSGWRTLVRGEFNRVIRERPTSVAGRLLDRIRRNRLRRSWVLERMRGRWAKGAARRLEAWRPDAIHCHDLDTLDVGARLSARLDVPYVYDSHELWRENNYLLKAPGSVIRRYRRMESDLIGGAACVIMTARSQAEQVSEWYPGVSPILVMNCQDGEPTPRTTTLRERFGLEENHRILLYQGLINADRGIFVALEALRRLPEPFVYIVLGDGQDSAELKRRIDSFGLAKRAFHPGSVPGSELPDATASADYGLALFQNTSLAHYLVSPNKVFEYMRAGLPVVASDFPEFQRLWSSADLGVRVDPTDAVAVANALLTLEDDRPRRERIHSDAQRLVRETFNWQNQMSNLLAVYESLAPSPTKRRN